MDCTPSTLLFVFLANLSEFTNSGNNNENLGILFICLTLWTYLLIPQEPGAVTGATYWLVVHLPACCSFKG